jgi:hypothetical protein
LLHPSDFLIGPLDGGSGVEYLRVRRQFVIIQYLVVVRQYHAPPEFLTFQQLFAFAQFLPARSQLLHQRRAAALPSEDQLARNRCQFG